MNLTLVSDSFDLWRVLTNYLPKLKELIMSRNGKLVIRPDSGDPVNIICGKGSWDYYQDWKTYNKFASEGKIKEKLVSESEFKGVIELLCR